MQAFLKRHSIGPARLSKLTGIPYKRCFTLIYRNAGPNTQEIDSINGAFLGHQDFSPLSYTPKPYKNKGRPLIGSSKRPYIAVYHSSYLTLCQLAIAKKITIPKLMEEILQVYRRCLEAEQN